MRERLLHRLVLRAPKATLEILRAYGEDLFRAIVGLELDCGKLWRRKSLGAGVNQPEDPWEVRERHIVYQPEDPWEVRERLLHRLVLRVPQATLEILRAYGEDHFRAIFGLELDCGKLWRRKSLGAGVNQPGDPWEVRERLLHRLVLRVPKATLEILREDLFRAIFGLELDCGKLWRRKSLGAGVNQPGDPWEVGERLIVYQPEHPWEVRERLLHRLVLRVPKATLEILRVYGEDFFRAIFGLELDCGKLWRRKSLGPARGPVGGERTAASQTCFRGSESDVRDSEGVRGGPL